MPELFSETHGQLENGIGRTREGIALHGIMSYVLHCNHSEHTYLLTEEDIIVFPEFADAETFPQATILVCFRKKPSSIHEILP